MLTHPGAAILPRRSPPRRSSAASGRDYLVAIAAGYEVMERLAARLIPSVMSRGFHAGPVFGIFGAAVAAAKLVRPRRDQIHDAIAQCVNLAAGNLEGARSGGRSCARAPPCATRCWRSRWPGTACPAARRRWRAMRASITRIPATTWASLRTASPARPRRPRQDHRRPGHGLDVPRDAVPDLLHGRLQHRARRRDRRAVRGARHPAGGRGPRRGGRELAGDAVPESTLPRAATHGRCRRRQPPLLFGLWRRGARLPGAQDQGPDPPEVLERSCIACA